MNTDTTIKQMAYGIKLLRETPISIIRRMTIYVEKIAKKDQLINILVNSNIEIQDPKVITKDPIINYNIIPKNDITHEYLDVLHQSLNDVKFLQQRIDPITDSGAIALTSIIYNIDISKSKNPILEFKIIKTTSPQNYIPVDNWLKYWYIKNSKLFDLTKTFNPIFSKKFYDKSITLNLAINEGFSSIELKNDDNYELLQLAHLTDTFYIGEMPYLDTNITPIDLDNISDIPYGELLSYGQINVKLKPISINEISNLFTNNENFTTPFDSSKVFSKYSINKLRLIVMGSDGPTNQKISDETIKNRANLVNIINSIEHLLFISDNPTKILAQLYIKSPFETKLIISKILTKLLHIGMYMRGWSGTGDFPLIKTPVPNDKELLVTIKVTESIVDYEKFITSNIEVGSIINNLPLVLYKDDQYTLSKNKSDGLSIIDRLSIVKLGDKTSNMSSCIRLTSNWICSSAHKYLCAICINPFNIKNLRYIS